MSNMQALLNERLKKSPSSSSKMANMAKQSIDGQLTSFSGVFSVSELSVHEKSFLEELLQTHSLNQEDLSYDLQALTSLTSEVKAINCQAAMLHGERIKRAHAILTRYRDGAFTSWLIAAYGNRQTPYNFLKYYEFCESMPKPLRPQIESMPRQAIYTLASREGTLEKKQEIVEGYDGETKTEILRVIRDAFPLSSEDKRKQNPGETALQLLVGLHERLERHRFPLSNKQKSKMADILNKILDMVS